MLGIVSWISFSSAPEPGMNLPISIAATGPAPLGPWQTAHCKAVLSYRVCPRAASPTKPPPLDDELLDELLLDEELLDEEELLLEEDELDDAIPDVDELDEDELLDELLLDELLLDEELLEVPVSSSEPPQPVKPPLMISAIRAALKAAFIVMMLSLNCCYLTSGAFFSGTTDSWV